MYSKAQQIRWQSEEFQKRLVLRLGEFHTTMAFLAIIGKRFCDAGLEDILIESGIVAQNSINGVTSGHHYNRSIRAHKLMSEALHKLRYKGFVQQHGIENDISSMFTQIGEEIVEQNGQTFISNENLEKHLQEYIGFVSTKNSNSTYAFWSSYLEMVEILLIFIRATREGNWLLHLSAVRSMLPWFFAYDRVNYSRYLSIYWCEMTNMHLTHPSVCCEFSAGKFAVQQQTNYGFSKTACDQVIEQTINRDSKTKGSLTGITQKREAVQRWVLSHHCRAAISAQLEDMAGKQNFF